MRYISLQETTTNKNNNILRAKASYHPFNWINSYLIQFTQQVFTTINTPLHFQFLPDLGCDKLYQPVKKRERVEVDFVARLGMSNNTSLPGMPLTKAIRHGD
jgi:hypothetical protein